MKKKQYATPACKMVHMRKRAHLLSGSESVDIQNSHFSKTETDI